MAETHPIYWTAYRAAIRAGYDERIADTYGYLRRLGASAYDALGQCLTYTIPAIKPHFGANRPCDERRSALQ